ncbi:hypothetical protein [Altericista sp. CCNU0014]|uniref:hypothetical protein n=1 Tax=Altericista sp. CCNU0014 TaxID=3082949 RepID=UPI00384EC5F2
MSGIAEQPKKILDRLRDVLCLKHYSYRTEQSSVDWVYLPSTKTLMVISMLYEPNNLAICPPR